MYSQAFQDEFVDMVLDKPTNGYFVDVGAGCDQPEEGSNSFAFELRGWQGICIDSEMTRMLRRTSKCVSAMIGDGNAKTEKLGDILKHNQSKTLVDYLSIDIEGQDFFAIKSFIESGFEFKVATIEHNLYSRNSGVDQLKADIFNFLSLNGYIRVVDNAGHQASASNLHRGWAFEDWYINPKHVDYKSTMKKINNLKSV